MRFCLMISFVVLVVSGCSAPERMSLPASGSARITVKRYSRQIETSRFSVTVTYVGINDSDLTFDISARNVSDRPLVLVCDRARLSVNGCHEQFEARIQNAASMRLRVPAGDSLGCWLQFRPIRDEAMPCFLTGGAIVMKGLSVWINGKRLDFGTFRFQPITLRLDTIP
jgi:hypothetical protein